MGRRDGRRKKERKGGRLVLSLKSWLGIFENINQNPCCFWSEMTDKGQHNYSCSKKGSKSSSHPGIRFYRLEKVLAQTRMWDCRLPYWQKGSKIPEQRSEKPPLVLEIAGQTSSRPLNWWTRIQSVDGAQGRRHQEAVLTQVWRCLIWRRGGSEGTQHKTLPTNCSWFEKKIGYLRRYRDRGLIAADEA